MYSDTLPRAVLALARQHTDITNRASAVWDGVIGDLIRKAPTAPHEIAITPMMNTLFLTRSAASRRVIKRNGPHGDQVLTHPGWLLNFVAAGDTLATIAPEGMPQMDRLAIAIAPEALQRLEFGQGGRRLELTSTVAIQGLQERHLVEALATELQNPGVHSRLYAETLGLALTISMARNYAVEAANLKPVKGGLAPWQVRQVTGYLDQNLAKDVSLAELAALVGMSQSHFSRAFRTSTGLPPHQYQLAARIERAKHLLVSSALPINEIAIACGFSEQSHLARAFRARVGVSPGAWRLERRS